MIYAINYDDTCVDHSVDDKLSQIYEKLYDKILMDNKIFQLFFFWIALGEDILYDFIYLFFFSVYIYTMSLRYLPLVVEISRGAFVLRV